MITKYKLKLIEGEKSVKQEIDIEGDNKEEIAIEAKSLYNLLKPFCVNESINKSGVNRG